MKSYRRSSLLQRIDTQWHNWDPCQVRCSLQSHQQCHSPPIEPAVLQDQLGKVPSISSTPPTAFFFGVSWVNELKTNQNGKIDQRNFWGCCLVAGCITGGPRNIRWLQFTSRSVPQTYLQVPRLHLPADCNNLPVCQFMAYLYNCS